MIPGRPRRTDPPDDPARRDLHSYANSDEMRVTHVELDLEVRFDERRLRGSAMLSFDRLREDADALVLDTRDLTIAAVESWSPNGGFDAATYSLAEPDAVLGAALTVVLPPAGDARPGDLRDEPRRRRDCSG